MNNLIQSITDYTTALEQKLSALEARVGSLQLIIDSLKLTVDSLQKENEALKAEIQQLSTVNYQLSTATEPEVEVELIMDEDEELEVPMEEPVEEPQEEPAEEPQEELETLDIVETPAAEPVVELVVEEPKVEPVVEKPAPRPMPQQTSLFGSAVEDIRLAISLGDRFLFQRELFAGNGEWMQKTLDELNGFGSLEEAMDYIANNFEWDKESTAVQLFENVLKRRFS
jgi:regulator of replication initiation timing